MRAHLFGLVGALILLSTPALAQEEPVQNETAARDCLRNTESGQHPPRTRGGKFLYITMFSSKDDKGNNAFNLDWKIASSLKEACDAAGADADEADSSSDSKWSTISMSALLIPDNFLREGLKH